MEHVMNKVLRKPTCYRSLMLDDGRPVLSVIGGGHANPFTVEEMEDIAAQTQLRINNYLPLLDEMKAAHQIIRNALAVMTTEQKAQWGRLNERDGVEGEGVTRANERAAVISAAEGK